MAIGQSGRIEQSQDDIEDVVEELSRRGIESALALLGAAGAASTAEATTGATADGIGAVARAVEMMEPTGPQETMVGTRREQGWRRRGERSLRGGGGLKGA